MLQRLGGIFLFIILACQLHATSKTVGLKAPFEQFGKLSEVKQVLKDNSIKEIPNVLLDTSLYQERFKKIGLVGYPKSIALINEICDTYPELIQIMVGTNSSQLDSLKTLFSVSEVPSYFVYLMPALSGYNHATISHDGRVGYWQLPYHVAASCNQKMDRFVDERMSYNAVDQATCAIEYIKNLYSHYKNWELTTQAFIHNPGALNAAITRAGTYSKLLKADTLLPEERRNSYYVLEALAYLHEYGKQHGLTPVKLALTQPRTNETLLIPDQMHMEPFTKVTGIKEDSVRYYNPELRQSIIPLGFDLKLPKKKLALVEEMCDSIYHYQDSVYHREKITYYIANKEKIIESRKVFKRPPGVAKALYTVKSGDNLGFIADWYDVGLSKIKFWNGIGGTRIYAGQTLVIYVPQSKESYYTQINELSFGEKQKLDGRTIIKESPRKSRKQTRKKTKPKPTYDPKKQYETYTVKSGDNLWLIAKKYPGVSAQNIMDLNGIDENLQPGQKLRIKER